MSDHDYGLLLQAVGWIEYHAGLDAPDYPQVGQLSGAVDCIDKRRESGVPHQRQPDGSAGGAPESFAVDHGVDIRCLDCGATVPFPAKPSEVLCSSCGLILYVTDTAAVVRYTGNDSTPGANRRG